MPKWVYKVTKHKINGETVAAEKIIECSAEGSCLVHDLNDAEMHKMTEFYNKQGSEGWELVQCTYHEKVLVCMWKREA